MSVAFDPKPLPLDAWRGWLRYAPRAALRSAPPVVLVACIAIAVSGGVSVFANSLLGAALTPLCFVLVAACLRARDTGVSTLRVLHRFLANGWRPILLTCVILLGAMLVFTAFGAVLAVLFPAFASKPATGLAAAARAPLVARIAGNGLRSFYICSMLPEIGFAVLLACDGTPGDLIYQTARKAVMLNGVSSGVLNMLGIGLMVLPWQPWILAPVLAPVCTAITYLAYQQVFHGTEPDKACPKREARPVAVGRARPAHAAAR
ncbi:MAG TPA: hypothetical protein VF292_02910 [Rhodanobacteraceae bacterium]